MKNFLSTKYHNHRIHACGEVFDSKKEFRRWRELLLLQDQGQITDLQRQVKFVLLPAQREKETVSPRGRMRPGKVIEREAAYYADLVYKENGETVVEDTKGVRTDAYILKRKMLLYFYGIQIREI